MAAIAPDAVLPFVQTSVARHLLSRLGVTHEERGIMVFAGPWGIGKSTAIGSFARDHECDAAIVTVEPGSRKGASPIAVMQLVIESLRTTMETRRTPLATLSGTHARLRREISDLFYFWAPFREAGHNPDLAPRFTLIFDEAQYLSPEAVEMLRFWNDGMKTTPFPVAIALIGNAEFSLKDDDSGFSVISGAVRSRALFIEELDGSEISDLDLTLFCQSRGLADAAGIAIMIRHFSGKRVKRDLRAVERLLTTCRRRAGEHAITADVVRSILS